MSRALREQDVLSYAWEEYVKGSGAAMTGSSKIGDARLTETLFFNWSDWVAGSVEREILGSARVTTAGKLRRTPAWRHPIKWWLYATDISNIEPVRFIGIQDEDNGYGPISGHDRVKLTVTFQAPPCPILSDTEYDTNFPDSPGQSNGEWQRYTIKENDPVLQVGQREGSSNYYVEGPVAGSKAGPTPYIAGKNNTPTEFRGQLPFLLPKYNVRVTWFVVPPKYIVDATTNIPLNFHHCLGKVNSEDWWGYPKGTLLLKGWQLIKEPAPFTVDGQATWDSQFFYRVIFNMEYYNPPIDIAAGNSTRGHNVAPWPFSTPNVGLGIANGLSYHIQLKPNGDGVLSDNFAGVDFKVLFQKVQTWPND